MSTAPTTPVKTLSSNRARKEIVADMQKVVKTDYVRYIGLRKCSAKEILRHVKRGTYFGKTYTNGFIENLKEPQSRPEPEVTETGFSLKKFLMFLLSLFIKNKAAMHA